ncbi:MAG: DNA-deoxyinosine glycosylase [Lachnospiraceae bacterium]|nr:DNA-deoxyinosine glycosylase [Lachnospiraceae bacterium]
MEATVQKHTFGPVYDKDSKILILGSFPSVKSREQNFYYGHPRNRFWEVLSRLYREDIPKEIEMKKDFLYRHHIALWDVCGECEIAGSADSTIRHVVPNEIGSILDSAKIKEIFVNGKKAEALFKTHLFPMIGRKAIVLPSTSPANAAYRLDELIQEWSRIQQVTEQENSN